MLNDLLSIERGLTAHGINLSGRHSDVKDMAKGQALRVRLSQDGRISSIEPIQEAGNGAVWTLRDGQHNGFPGLKTASGLLALDAQAAQTHEANWNADKSPQGRRDELLRLLSLHSVKAKSWPSAGHRRRIAERLSVLRSIAADPMTASVPAAFERFLASLDLSPSFLEQLTEALKKRLNRSDDWIELVRAALIGPVALAIDVKEMEFQRDAGDARQVQPVSGALSSQPARAGGGGEALCALSGKLAELHAGNFPQPNLPGLGQTYIYSRNKDIPSLTRYGRTADASFPVGAELVRRLSGAVTTLTREERKGDTWRLIPAESGDKPDLLVVSMADPKVRPADAVADDEEGAGEAALKELASRVIDQSKGVLEHGHPEDEVTVLVLRTVDPANRKAIYHRKSTSAEFWRAARNWRDAAANTPTFLSLPAPGKAKSEVIVRRPPYVAPLSITSISRVQFANGGRRPIDVIGTSAAEAFQLFLDGGSSPRRAQRLLNLLVERHGDLLSGVAAARTKGSQYLKDFDPKVGLRRAALRSVTWIGALLHHLGRSKEVYMSDAGFRLGQLLAAADVVHVGYCKDVRNGSIPPSLLGNALLGMAAERPHEALKLLCKRWPPYSAWAMRKARWALRQIEPIAADLKQALKNIDGRTDDVFQAELLLGYMAGLPPAPKRDDSDSDKGGEE